MQANANEMSGIPHCHYNMSTTY